jgi:hypothetical protein
VEVKHADGQSDVQVDVTSPLCISFIHCLQSALAYIDADVVKWGGHQSDPCTMTIT